MIAEPPRLPGVPSVCPGDTGVRAGRWSSLASSALWGPAASLCRHGRSAVRRGRLCTQLPLVAPATEVRLQSDPRDPAGIPRSADPTGDCRQDWSQRLGHGGGAVQGSRGVTRRFRPYLGVWAAAARPALIRSRATVSVMRTGPPRSQSPGKSSPTALTAAAHRLGLLKGSRKESGKRELGAPVVSALSVRALRPRGVALASPLPPGGVLVAAVPPPPPRPRNPMVQRAGVPRWATRARDPHLCLHWPCSVPEPLQSLKIWGCQVNAGIYPQGLTSGWDWLSGLGTVGVQTRPGAGPRALHVPEPLYSPLLPLS